MNRGIDILVGIELAEIDLPNAILISPTAWKVPILDIESKTQLNQF